VRQSVAKHEPSHQHECKCMDGCTDTVLVNITQVLGKPWRGLESRRVGCTRLPLGMSVSFEIVDQDLYVL
jgi:hypothetical protein